ncbi:MAG: N-acyl homoserine lactonase family protein [Dehalococcoidales bacterium]|nr:N-acyl homoserine lactonase family protein [Dehalococcoidales bacterium]
MADCIIHPIPLYRVEIEKSLFTYRLGFGQIVSLSGYVWFIEGTQGKLLVDAGGSAEYMSQVRGMPTREIQTLDSGLAKLGLSFDDIDLIILTHLHYDHVALASRFTKAKFLVQKEELEFALNPHPLYTDIYYQDFYNGLNFEVIDGDTRLSDEISVLKTPGHTRGGQSVSIKTAQGIVIIAGLCTIRENFNPPATVKLPVLPPGMPTDVSVGYDSVLRIKKVADIVVPIHDPEYCQVNTIP